MEIMEKELETTGYGRKIQRYQGLGVSSRLRFGVTCVSKTIKSVQKHVAFSFCRVRASAQVESAHVDVSMIQQAPVLGSVLRFYGGNGKHVELLYYNRVYDGLHLATRATWNPCSGSSHAMSRVADSRDEGPNFRAPLLTRARLLGCPSQHHNQRNSIVETKSHGVILVPYVHLPSSKHVP